MTGPVVIEPNSVWDDGALYCCFGLTEKATAKARRSGVLRYTRQGKRVLYLGQWILDWLKADAIPSTPLAGGAAQ